MNVNPTPKKIIVSIILVLASYMSLAIIPHVSRFIKCRNYDPYVNSDIIGIAPHICIREYDSIFESLLKIQENHLFFSITAILFSFFYLIYSFFEKK